MPIDDNATAWNGAQEIDRGKAETRYTAIPCTENLYFLAGKTEQKVNIYNPDSNSCLIIFTLSLDGKVLWKSGYCSPGNGYYEIELERPMDVGEYDGTLAYDCFSGDGRQLNSALMDVHIIVRSK